MISTSPEPESQARTAVDSDPIQPTDETGAKHGGPRRPRWMWGALAAVAVVVLVVATAAGTWLLTRPGPSLEDSALTLEKRDPNGAVICLGLGDWINGQAIDETTGRSHTKATIEMTAGQYSAKSTTRGIRAAGRDLRRVHAACLDAGVAMPAYDEPTM